MKSNKILISNITNLYGEQGRAWLSSLPALLQSLQSRWHLSNLTPVDNMTFNYVAKAVSKGHHAVVLKMSYDKKSLLKEMQALQYFNGLAAIKLIDYDEELNALLLQQAVPGITLKSLYPQHVESVVSHYVDTMQSLHSKFLPKEHKSSHIADWLKVLDEASSDNFPTNMLNQAINLKNTLLKTSDTEVFLHGDLHQDNILQDGNQWLVIDPKGVVGDPTFEIAAFDFIHSAELANQPNIIKSLFESRVALIANKANLNAQRIKDWVFIRLVLSAAWSIEDNCDPSAAINFANLLFQSTHK